MNRLKDKIVIVTGGARGMGAATSRLFAGEGAAVVIADLPDSPGQALAAELRGGAQFLALNVAVEAQWQALVASLMQRHGRIDALVNNAAVVHFSGTDQEPQPR